MKKEKGEAAFESVDEVLAERIIENSEDHAAGASKAEKAADEAAATTGNRSPRSGILAAIGLIVAILLATAGWFLKNRKPFTKKRFFRLD